MKYLLDADSVIDHLTQTVDLARDIIDLHPRDLAIAASSLIELYTGVYSARDPQQAQRELRHFLRAVNVIPLNRRVVHATARLRAELIASGKRFRQRAYDVLVAATAREYGLIVVTSNFRDYEDIPGLQLYNPRTKQSM